MLEGYSSSSLLSHSVWGLNDWRHNLKTLRLASSYSACLHCTVLQLASQLCGAKKSPLQVLLREGAAEEGMREKPEKLLQLREGPTVVVLCYPKVLGNLKEPLMRLTKITTRRTKMMMSWCSIFSYFHNWPLERWGRSSQSVVDDKRKDWPRFWPLTDYDWREKERMSGFFPSEKITDWHKEKEKLWRDDWQGRHISFFRPETFSSFSFWQRGQEDTSSVNCLIFSSEVAEMFTLSVWLA